MAKLQPALGFSPNAWTAGATLPGGDLPNAAFGPFLNDRQRAHPWLPTDLALRYARNYGTRMEQIVGHAHRLEDLGRDLGGGIHEAELDYVLSNEWVVDADDMLWRRSKMGLRVPDGTAARLQKWLDTHGTRQRSPASSAG